MQATPATWRALLDAGWQGSAELTMLCGGEAMSTELATTLIGRLGPRFVHPGRKKGVVIVRSSRVPTGTVGRNVEVNDDELGFVASDELNPQKSRILLMLALLKPRTTAELQTLFQSY